MDEIIAKTAQIKDLDDKVREAEKTRDTRSEFVLRGQRGSALT